ncbi:unnamed protein product [Rotaria magnacalcarata]|uniref:CCR4-NOT transcription complex subunit 10 n=7 Tax=Rotaria magnacalcarata TaxID=392030 RepID=A0A816RYI3_9BILA|nr:unnamed protein product [Rotaria magnacalcarata]
MDIRMDNESFQKMKLIIIEEFKDEHKTIKFNHKIYRLLIKKLRRKLKRQQQAKERDEKIRLEELQRQNDPLYQAWIIQKEKIRLQKEVEEEEENKKARKLREQREQMELQQQQELTKERVEKQKKLLLPAKTNSSSHNPFATVQDTITASIERPVCSFYSKTGVCRYGERCHRTHSRPDITNTLLAMNMYSNFEMQYGLDNEYDFDIGLEFEESERYENFKDFFYDVLPEFERFGRVLMFKVCYNSGIHLRGNVYVQYKTDYEAMQAYKALNTRYYAGRMVQCQFVNIPSWTAAICGLSEFGKCPKGRRCHYLHVFRNPPIYLNTFDLFTTMSEDNNTTTNNNIEQCSIFTEQDKELAVKAKQEYEAGQYDVCLKTLQKILESCPDDPKVLFNIALTEYAMSSFQKTDAFKVQLNKIAEKLHCSLDGVTTLEEPDQCTVFYNMAVLLYHMRQYQSALLVVEKLFRFIGQIDETLSWKICLLMCELDLCTFQPENALATVVHLDKLISERVISPSNGLSHSPNMLIENLEVLKSKISLYKIRCLLMLKSLRICKKELRQLQNTNISSTSLTYARANFEYFKENHIRALKILTNNQQTNSSSISLQTNSSHCFYNNLSCIHFHLHKSAFALFYMRRALAENNRLLIEQLNSNDKQLIVHNINRKYEILYNLGIQLLFKHQPLPAFECLIDVINIYSNNVRLWLRLAECCIMIHRSSNDDIFKLEEKLKCVLQSIGTGFHHKLILGNCNTSTSSKKSTVINGNEKCSMEFALFCLKNALASLPSITEDDLQKDGTKHYPAPPGNTIRIGDMIALKCSILTAAAYVSLCLNDFVSAKNYATYLLEESRASSGHKYLARLYLSESLLAMNKIDLAISQLDAESIKTENDLSFKMSITTVDKEEKSDTPEATPTVPKADLVSWLPRDARVGQAIVYYNIAAIYAITNDVEKAFKHFNLFVNLFGKTQPAHSFQLKFYLDLLDGNRHRLQILLKENFGHLTSNKSFVAFPTITHTLSNNNS